MTILTRRQTLASLTLAASTLSSQSLLAQPKRRISIATGGTGGAYYPIGGGIANLISKNITGVEATAEVTGGGVDNIRLLSSNSVEIGFANAGIVQDALTGQDRFAGKPVPLRTLVALFPNRMHVVTLEGKGIETMEQLRGKRVSTGAPGSGTEVIAFRILEAYGINRYTGIKRERLSAAESVNALKDGKIDAFIFGAAMPVASITDLAATPGIRMRLIDHGDAVDRMNQKFGNIFSRGSVPAGVYPNHERVVSSVDIYDLIVVPESFDAELAHRIVKLMFEAKKDLVAVHRNMEAMVVQNQRALATAPLHAGAERYLKEIGA
ncbi:MAG: TAXI family TRAP transporter solute-binding subunit [Beijerinckiaceae bacterium]